MPCLLRVSCRERAVVDWNLPCFLDFFLMISPYLLS